MTIDVQLRHRFGAFALDVAFAIDKPGITALFGPSGAGKTVTANAIAGLFRPAQGKVSVDNRVLFDSDARIFVPPRARHIGYVFQDARLFPHMSVENNLRFGWRRAAQPASESEFARIAALLGLKPLLTRKPQTLSGGEKARVALGRALLSSPSLLILDEPLASLDAARKEEILPWFERLRDEAALPMVYVTHALDEVARLADTVVALKNGAVAARGSTFDILPDLEFTKLGGGVPVGAVFPAAVAVERTDDGLTQLAFDGGTLLVPRLHQREGARVRVRFRAEDVMLARVVPGAISANNVLPATVKGSRIAGDSHADVQLQVGNVKVVARITWASLARLKIEPGMALFAIVKSVTVDSR